MTSAAVLMRISPSDFRKAESLVTTLETNPGSRIHATGFWRLSALGQPAGPAYREMLASPPGP